MDDQDTLDEKAKQKVQAVKFSKSRPSVDVNADQSEPIIIMISHIMINQLYHIVSVTDKRPK